MYYNTTKTTANKLKKFAKTNKRQDKLILELFKINPKLELSPFEVQTALKRLRLLNAPITSIRRAMTDLTTQGNLTRTNTRKLGPYGRDSFCWKFKA